MNKLSKKSVLIIYASVSVIIFTVSMAICAYYIVKADRDYDTARLMEKASSESVSIAETLKASDGDLSRTGRLLKEHQIYEVNADTLILCYDDALEPSADPDAPFKAFIRKTEDGRCCIYDITFSDTASDAELYKLSFTSLRTGDKKR